MPTRSSALPTQYDVFISHRSDNKPWVEILARNLQHQGYKVFLDLWELVPAGSLTQGLFQGLQQSRAGIVVVTPEVWESGWVREEYQQMMAQKVRNGFVIIPVVLGRDIPAVPFLQDILWINFRSPSPEAYREAFYRLLCALEQRPPGPEVLLHDPLLMPPEPAMVSPPSGDELAFIAGLFERLYTQQVILLFAQADRGPSAFSAPFPARAYGQFGRSQVVHLTLPCTPEPGRLGASHGRRRTRQPPGPHHRL